MTVFEKEQFLSENFRGVGPAKAKKIAEVLKDYESLLNVPISKEVMSLLNEAVGLSLTNKVMEQLKVLQSQKDTVKEMVDCGMPYFASVKIVQDETEAAEFAKNPYETAKRLEAKFHAIDLYIHREMAKNENAPDLRKDRMTALIDAAIQDMENCGNTYVSLAQLRQRINKYQKHCGFLPDNFLESTVLLYLYDNPGVVVEKAKKLEQYRIYRKKTYDLETAIAYHIRRLAVNLDDHKEHVPISKSGAVKYDEVQEKAIMSVYKSGLKIITGPPGSGKTAVINGIIRQFKASNPQKTIALCAPTGRAAKHMTEITGEPSSTIHRMLGIGNPWKEANPEKLECSLLICDEASMLTLDITYQLLSRIKSGATIYFVGDKDQLPAVGPGNVLHDIINSKVVPVYYLTKVYRQDGIILENAHEINSGRVPQKRNELYKEQAFEKAEDVRMHAVQAFCSLYDKNEPFETQILIPSYKTECGIRAVNKAIQELNPEKFCCYNPVTETGYKMGDKILMTKNHTGGLYQNGSVGIFKGLRGEDVLVEFEGEEKDIPRESLDDMTLGYAISVHKSQGSEYKHVILCLPEDPVNMLRRNIFYTAVTRAKKDILILGMPGTVKRCVETNEKIYTQTGLQKKIAESGICVNLGA